jgi:hypothetical protein
MADSPLWRHAVDRVERRVAPPLTSVTSSPDLLATLQYLLRLQRTLTGTAGLLVSHVLHVAGLPSHEDMRALERQISALQREVVALRRNVLDAERDRQEGT